MNEAEFRVECSIGERVEVGFLEEVGFSICSSHDEFESIRSSGLLIRWIDLEVNFNFLVECRSVHNF